MRILNLQVSKTHGLRVVENIEGGIDFVKFPIDGHYVNPTPGVPDELVCTIPVNRREMIADFISLHIMIEDKPSPKPAAP